MAWEKWYTGKTLASFTYQAFGFWIGMKMSDKNRSGLGVRHEAGKGQPQGREAGRSYRQGGQEGRERPAGKVGAVEGLPEGDHDDHQQDRHQDGVDDPPEHVDPGRHGSSPDPLQDARVPLERDAYRQVREGGGDDGERADGGDIEG